MRDLLLDLRYGAFNSFVTFCSVVRELLVEVLLRAIDFPLILLGVICC